MATANIRSNQYGQDLAAAAKRAARQAGMTLGEWLDAVVNDTLEARSQPAPTHPPRGITTDPSAPTAGVNRLSRHLARHTPNHVTDASSDFAGPAANPVRRQIDDLIKAIARQAPAQSLPIPPAPPIGDRDIAANPGASSQAPSAARQDHDRQRRMARETVSLLETRLRNITRRMQANQRPKSADVPIVPDDAPVLEHSANIPRPSQVPSNRILNEAMAAIAARQAALKTRIEPMASAGISRPADAPFLVDTNLADVKLMMSEIARSVESVPAKVTDDVIGRLEDAIGRLDTATRSELDAIRGELREIALDMDQSAQGEFGSLRAEIAHLANLIESSPAQSPASEDARFEVFAAQLTTAANSEFESLRGELAELSTRVDASTAALTPDIKTMLDDIACRLDTAARSEFTELRAEIRELAEEIDRATHSEFDALRAELREMGGHLANSPVNGADDIAELDNIRRELHELGVQIDAGRRDDYAALRLDMEALVERFAQVPTSRLNEIEKHLGLLSSRLAGANQEADPAALAQIEAQIARLAENVEVVSRHMIGAAELDKAIGDLFARIDEGRVETADAVRVAATQAVERSLATASARLPGRALNDAAGAKILVAVRDELSAQRNSSEAADRRTQDTLHVVHRTLMKVVGCLEDFEIRAGVVPANPYDEYHETAANPDNDSSGPTSDATDQNHGSPAPGSHPTFDPNDIVGRLDAAVGNSELETQPAGSSTTAQEQDQPKSAPTSGSDETSSSDDEPPSSDLNRAGRADFVAAARRAAKAAEHIDNTGRSAGTRKSGTGGLRELLAKFRRPVAIGAIALLIVLGVAVIANLLNNPLRNASAVDRPTRSGMVSGGEKTAAVPRLVKRNLELTKSDDRVSPDQALSNQASSGRELAGKVPANTVLSAVAGVTPVGEVSTDVLVPNKLRQAAAAGDPTAQFEMAMRYADGRGLPKSLETAIVWYGKAAAQGLAPAQYRLGSLYEKGQGVERDLAMARKWYGRAAEKGNRKAMHNLAVLFTQGVDGNHDYETAAKWFRQAAEHDLGDSQFNLAVLYARGLGVQADLSESYRWFALAADHGDAEALQKRDEVALDLDEFGLSKARATLKVWAPIIPDPVANVVPVPAGGWDGSGANTQVMIGFDMVQHAQVSLKSLGYSLGAADGQVDPRTRDAVRSFQRSIGLPDTGEITQELVNRLDISAS